MWQKELIIAPFGWIKLKTTVGFSDFLQLLAYVINDSVKDADFNYRSIHIYRLHGNPYNKIISFLVANNSTRQ